jgi:hypothetical protein
MIQTHGKIEIEEVLNGAIDNLISKHPILLELDISERALTHHLANYIREKIPEFYDVDVEYNRHFADPKRINLPSRTTNDTDTRARTAFPDIIIHKRNKDSDNLLVLEIKKPGEDLEYDKLKLAAFVKELKYMNAAHIVIRKDTSGNIVREIIWENSSK